ncbi:MAG: MFS transporter [Dehalococcoidia bacterium]|nr:MFS transporter [Dehalococcoidia bacterium]
MGGFFSRVAWGFIVERVSVYYCMLAAAVGTIIAVTILTLANGAIMAFVSAFLYGFWMGGLLTLGGIAWADYYGRQFQGTIRGTAWAFQSIGHGAGPLIAALVYDLTNSYRLAYGTLDAALLISLALLFFAKPPRHAASDHVFGLVQAKEGPVSS